MDFINEQIDISQLPDYGTIQYERPHPSYRRLIQLSTSIILGGLFIIASIAALVIWGPSLWVILGCGIAWIIFGLIFWLEMLGIKYIGYALRDHDILYKSGVIWRSTTVIPFNRVQHCEIGQGPLERYFGLARLKVFTAGGSSSDLEIAGLTKAYAEKMKDLIMRKRQASLSDEEE